MANILVSGGSGLVGQRLCKILVYKGHKVTVLSRRELKASANGFNYTCWDPGSGVIDRKVLNDAEIIIHLAGANIGAGRWTAARKKKIVESRVKTAQLIHDALNIKDNKLKAFISSSAIGYYGSVSSDKVFKEEDAPANDFLGETCRKWEQSADSFKDYGVRVVKLRTAVVLSKRGGVLSKLYLPVRAGIGSALGSGRQYLPWIHIDDLCKMYLHAVENKDIDGSYNAVAPEHITMKEFVRSLARTLNRPFWFPNIPSWVIRLIFGEMSVILLEGSRISSEKILETGFSYLYPGMVEALQDIY